MERALYVAALICTTVGVILFIAASASSSWIVGCLSYDKVLKAMETDPKTAEFLPANYREKAKVFSGMKYCVNIGLLHVTMKLGSVENTTFAVDGLPTVARISIPVMWTACGISVIGAILLLVATIKNTEENIKIAKCKRFGTRFLFLAGCVGLAAMAAYTGGTYQIVKDPMMFLAQVAYSMKSIIVTTSSGFTPLVIRPKRDLSLTGLPPDTIQFMNTMVEGMEPSYGYAFALGWVAVALMVSSAVLVVVPRDRSQSSNGYTPMDE